MGRFLCIWLLATTAPLSAQVDAVPRAFQPTAERPAEVVARMARRAMGLPDDPEAWQALAEVLPELALSGEADLEGTFQAARVADSLSATAATGLGASQSEGQAWFPRWTALPSGALPSAVALAVALAAALSGALVVVLRRRRSRATEARRDGGTDKLGAARSLVTRGLPAYEISRRTGMAQDAVQVMLAMSGATPRPRPRPRTHARTHSGTRATLTGNPRRAPGAAGVDRDELEREARAAAARLRDTRLTYGPGARA